MEKVNNVTTFIFLGLSQNPEAEEVCFVVFSLFYMASLLGNLLIMLTVRMGNLFKFPMYFFLNYLSLVDICYSSVIAPKMIVDLLAKMKSISYVGCVLQLFGSHFFGSTEIFILVVMAYDRYVAICKPLHYMTIMDQDRCNKIMLGSWVGGFLHAVIQMALVVQLPFCGPNVIDHYFCDVHPVLKLACTDTYVIGVVETANSGTVALGGFVILLISYTVILVSLRKQSAEGRRKALSTCGSHIAVVVMFFGPCTFMYMRPDTTFAEDKMVAVFYTIITPMLNPLIYTLRNAEVKNAMKKLWCRKVSWVSNDK
ncbi:olfactory receptor 4S2-like [Orycteropus afer afer]|uniref:Olfactory receptor n=1 Tax=Orycteropus afer afer TaxID=1230840 RepID=A0A8B7B8S9_ORYAF|nr:olfactory receptor 4S2-like [Orycteropus afer afer]XP_007955997.1 olfactory receptor 4S2-like [Orycteropus afer afer]